jgi:hypothetical protein
LNIPISNSGTSSINNNDASFPSAQVEFSEPLNERGQVNEEYQKQVDLEILYQNAMIAHLQSKQISKRSKAAFSGITSIEFCPDNHEQQENLWNFDSSHTSMNDEQHAMCTTFMHDSIPKVLQPTHELDTHTSRHN